MGDSDIEGSGHVVSTQGLKRLTRRTTDQPVELEVEEAVNSLIAERPGSKVDTRRLGPLRHTTSGTLSKEPHDTDPGLEGYDDLEQ